MRVNEAPDCALIIPRRRGRTFFLTALHLCVTFLSGTVQRTSAARWRPRANLLVVRAADLVDGFCRACSQKMGTTEAALEQGLALLDDMNGHPGMAGYRDRGYEVITF
jgi:hypothetical protein